MAIITRPDLVLEQARKDLAPLLAKYMK